MRKGSATYRVVRQKGWWYFEYRTARGDLELRKCVGRYVDASQINEIIAGMKRITTYKEQVDVAVD